MFWLTNLTNQYLSKFMQRVLVWIENNNNDHDLKSTRPRNAEAEVLKNWGFWIPFIWNIYYHFIILQVKLGIIRHDIELTKCISLNVSWLLLRSRSLNLWPWLSVTRLEHPYDLDNQDGQDLLHLINGFSLEKTTTEFSMRPIHESEPPYSFQYRA